MLVTRIIFQVSTYRAALQATKLTSKLRQKQTVANKLKLQQFVETEMKGGKLQQTIDRTAQYEDGYSEFLKDFKRKHTEHSNLMDMTHYASSPLNKAQSLREEELRTLQNFLEQKRRNLQARNFHQPQQDSDFTDDDINDEDVNERPTGEFQLGEWETRSGFVVQDQFFTLLLDRDTNTQVTTLQRINSFRQLIFIGNGNGVIGYGKGKGYDYEEALLNAIKDAKRNLVPIPLDLWMTNPLTLESKFNDFKLKITPRPKGFNSLGNPTMASMLILAGMMHCSFKCQSRNQVPYAMAYAFFKAVSMNVTPSDIAEATGKKVYRQYFGKRIGRQVPVNTYGI